MKKRDKDELHKASVIELDKKATEIRKQIAEIVMTMQTKEVKNRHQAKELRRKLAVILSVKRVKGLLSEKGNV